MLGLSTCRGLLLAAGVVWVVGVAFGVSRLWRYDAAAGVPAQPPESWPAGSEVPANLDLPKLFLLVHPHCPCSRATIGELAKLMTACHGKLAATVLMLRPGGAAEGWERTDLWHSAAAIPGVSVVADEGGAEARRLGAGTSGQAVLYSRRGRLLFAGGITESRGHSGDNAGRTIVETLVLGPTASHGTPLGTPVYGCDLFDEPATCETVGGDGCDK
jgi:hypothetical protein